jgi:hypothetical protein
MPMYWYDTNTQTWRETVDLFAYDDGQWKQVIQCWIHDGIDWKLTHTAPTTLSSVFVFDSFCDPTSGNFRVTWSYNSPNISDWAIHVEYSFNSGVSYNTLTNNADASTGQYDGSLEGVSGFSSLDNTYFRISLKSIADGSTNAISSPQVRTPPFACL